MMKIPRGIVFGLGVGTGLLLVAVFGFRPENPSGDGALHAPGNGAERQNRDAPRGRVSGGARKRAPSPDLPGDWIAGEIKTITPASARGLLEAIHAGEKDVFERTILSTRVLIALAEAGFPDEAWSMVNDGYGEIRGYQIRALMNRWTIPLERRIGYLDSLADPRERSEGLPDLLSSLTPGEMAGLDPKRFGIRTDADKRAVGFAFSGVLETLHNTDPAGFAGEAEQIVAHAMKMTASGDIRFDELGRILSAWYFDDGFGVWNLLDEAGLAGAPARDVREKTIRNMLRKDADRAFEVIMNDGGPEGGAPYLPFAVAVFYELDSIAANKWLVDEVAGYPGGIRDRIYAEVALVAHKGGETDAAQAWAGWIGDETERSRIQRRLRGEE